MPELSYVIFMFVVVLFQDAHQQISHFKAMSSPWLLLTAALTFILMLGFYGKHLFDMPAADAETPIDFGFVQLLGKELYVDFFFPF